MGLPSRCHLFSPPRLRQVGSPPMFVAAYSPALVNPTTPFLTLFPPTPLLFLNVGPEFPFFGRFLFTPPPLKINSSPITRRDSFLSVPPPPTPFFFWLFLFSNLIGGKWPPCTPLFWSMFWHRWNILPPVSHYFPSLLFSFPRLQGYAPLTTLTLVSRRCGLWATLYPRSFFFAGLIYIPKSHQASTSWLRVLLNDSRHMDFHLFPHDCLPKPFPPCDWGRLVITLF